jgi:hypothetical protein
MKSKKYSLIFFPIFFSISLGLAQDQYDQNHDNDDENPTCERTLTHHKIKGEVYYLKYSRGRKILHTDVLTSEVYVKNKITANLLTTELNQAENKIKK